MSDFVTLDEVRKLRRRAARAAGEPVEPAGVRLHRVQHGRGPLPQPRYTTRVRVIGSSFEPFDLLIHEIEGVRPFRQRFRSRPASRWLVETDSEHVFTTLKAAREYINRFFEPA